jgi:hypothetical protein
MRLAWCKGVATRCAGCHWLFWVSICDMHRRYFCHACESRGAHKPDHVA